MSEVQGGVYYLLLDNQTRVDDDEYVHYQRLVAQPTGRSGLEDAARLQFKFDPLEETLVIHAVRVRRGDDVADRLDPSAVLVMRAEQDIANGVTDGDLTAYYEVPDVRVGDIVEYEVSWVHRSQLWPGQFSSAFSLRWSVPLEYRRMRILLAQNRKLNIRNRNTEAQPSVSVKDGMREYVWETVDPDPVPAQDATPSSYANWAQISVSTFSDWTSVVDSLFPKYEAAAALPEDFIAREKWLAQGDDNQRITAAVRYVQDKIRYVADETGVGSHLPRRPAQVIARGWGDCKGKSLLLVALLRHLGVEAYVALTDLDAGYALPQLAPTPWAFDHAIVAYRIDGGGWRWIDATSFEQGGVFPDIVEPAYGYGLPLRAGDAKLLAMAPLLPSAPEKVVRETFDVAELATAGVNLRVESEYSGREADKFRRSLGASSQSKLSQDYLKYYQDHYPGIAATSELQITDERDANHISTLETYRLDKENYGGAGYTDEFPLRADAVLNVVSRLNLDARTAPISLPFPVDYQHDIVLENVGSFDGLTNLEATSDYFSYARKETLSDVDVTFSYRLKTLAAEAPLGAGEDYEKATKDLDDWGSFNYTPGASEGEELSLAEPLAIAAAIAVIGALIYLPFGIVFTFKHDNLKMDDEILHPVSIAKFAVLTFLTLGLYAIFWTWRCWRWVKQKEARSLMPFWRSVFSVFWYYPLFAEIRNRQEEPQTPTFFGALLAIAYFFVAIATSVAEKVFEGQSIATLGVMLVSLAGTFLILPLVAWVNGLNRDRSDAIAANSRWTGSTIGALLIGVSYWSIVLVGVFAPE